MQPPATPEKPLIVVDGTRVRIFAGYLLDVPIRQGFAWAADAAAYAKRLSAERGWPIETVGGEQ